MPEGEPAVQARVLLLPDPDLHSVLHAGHRVLGVVLARRQRRSGQSVARCHHSVDHGDPDHGYQQLVATRLLHQGMNVFNRWL